MLATLRRLPQFDARLRDGDWAAEPAVQDRLAELGGRTVGIAVAIWRGAPSARADAAGDGLPGVYAARSPKPDALGIFVLSMPCSNSRTSSPCMSR